MRRPIIAGNWKMYKTIGEAIELANSIKRSVYNVENVEIVICPPFVDLSDVGEVLVDTNIHMGGQNCHWETEGAFTGEVSVAMIKSTGAEYVIVGHSERRKYFGETDETVNRKIAAAMNEKIKPIVCVGETLEERENGKTLEVVRGQVTGGLKGFGEDFLEELVIAYEPVWAIGTGKNATPDEAQEVHAMIRRLLGELYSHALSVAVRVLYGGSVKVDNIAGLMAKEDIDGALIGGASLKADGFVDIIKQTAEMYKNQAS